MRAARCVCALPFSTLRNVVIVTPFADDKMHAIKSFRYMPAVRCHFQTRTLFIEPGSPWENGYCESFNSKLRDELLAGEVFSTLHEAKVLVEQWRRHYNAIRPHSSLGYRPPAPETILPPASALPTLRSGQLKRWPRAAGV